MVIGAAPAGLTAAYLLAKLGASVTVLEASDMVGGLSQTAQYRGYRFDIGGHRFFTKVAPVEALWNEILGDQMISVPCLSRIAYRGKYFDYPLKPMNALLGLGAWNAAMCVASYVQKTLGFPVSPKFAALNCTPKPEPDPNPKVLYMINAGKRIAPEIVQRVVALPNVNLTVTVGRDEKLRRVLEGVRATSSRSFEIIGWTDDMPRLMHSSHLLIGKAGGATVQETIAAGSPMIINQVVPGQEEGNARLIVETGCGVVATSPEAVAAAVERAFADDEKLWREWFANIRQLGRPTASLDIARFILSL